jgi:hypothetical protein
MATVDLPAEPHLQTEWGPALLARTSACIICGAPAREGRFQLCEPCRNELKAKSARRRAAMRPALCLGCRLGRPAQGSVYCPRCAKRFGELMP